ncbi:SMEK domain-containing protein [Arcicella lustrica]|uniref:SMEK domain-containing protein n=1 Tax=Arcicella lustrica TaxID=2984196 RepID=A0ABU5SGJ9_9BACT|nr:SMEK domain-containing protein [Arcicella sp. DC25W]MEA5426394.1 SMEK domain-containing protein [Arcicella sp. DC25W]
MLNQSQKIDGIIEMIASWITSISFQNSIGRYNINTDSEDFCIPLLNLLYDLDLKNQNNSKFNFPGIDVADDIKSKIAFQITSRLDSAKIIKTVRLFSEHKLRNTYSSGVKVVVLNSKGKVKFGIKSLQLLKQFQFDPENDIIYPETLIREIKNLYVTDQERFKKIDLLLTRELSGIATSFGYKNDLPDDDTRVIKRRRQFVGLIPQHKDEFQGRDVELKSIRNLLCESKSAVIINGLPGIGKSALAKMFIRINRDNYDKIIWIDIRKNENEDNLIKREEAFFTAFHHLEVHLKIDFSCVKNSREKFELIINELNNYEGENLLVIDNIGKEFSTIIEIMPGPPNWHILGTSQLPINGLDNYLLFDLDQSASIALFQKWYKNHQDELELLDLFKEIGRHPLMIELVAKTLLTVKPVVTVRDFIDRLKTKKLNDPSLQKSIFTSHIKGESQLYHHLMITFDLTEVTYEDAIILRKWAYLLPDSYQIDELAESMNDAVSTNQNFNSQLNSLLGKAWLNYEDGTFTMHPLLQKIIFYKLSPTLSDAVSIIKYITEKLSELKYEVTSKYLPKAEFLISNLVGEEKITTSVGYLFYSMASAYEWMVQNEQALEAYKEALRIYKEITIEYDNEPTFRRIVAQILLNLGCLYKNMDAFADSETCFKEAIVISTELTKLAPSVYAEQLARIYNRYADLFANKEDYKTSKSYFKKAIKTIGLLNQDAVDVVEFKLNTMNSLAIVYLKERNFTKADEIAWEVTIGYLGLAVKDRGFLVHVAMVMNNHGSIFMDANLLEEAESYFFKSINYLRNVTTNKPEDYDIKMAQIVINLAKLHDKMGKIDYSNKSYKYALELFMEHLDDASALWKVCFELAIKLARRLINDQTLVTAFLAQASMFTMYCPEMDLKGECFLEIEEILALAGIDSETFYKIPISKIFKSDEIDEDK